MSRVLQHRLEYPRRALRLELLIDSMNSSPSDIRMLICQRVE